MPTSRVGQFDDQRRSELTVASFFAGIGGFDLGFEKAGLRVVWQSEIDEFCRTILRQRWPNVELAGDIREVTPGSIPEADVWTGGFPCQDVSLARMGPRKGLRGAKSGLFFEFADLIERRTPRVVVIENVPGLRSSHGGRDFETVIRTLAEIGYGVGWRVLNSRYFGVPQSRQRVFIVGVYRDPGAAGRILFESECGERDNPTRRQDGTRAPSPFKAVLGDPLKGPLVKGIAHCVYAESARHTGTDWSRNYVSYPDGRVRRLVPVEVERLQGFPDGWTLPDGANQDVKLDSARYRAVGNAVTVNVAEWLGNRIRKVLTAGGPLRCEICGTTAPTPLPLDFGEADSQNGDAVAVG